MRVTAALPPGPVPLEAVVASFPTLRQSVLAKHDDCSLSSFFALNYTRLFSTHRQGAGIIGHRTLAECLLTMKRQNHDRIPPGEALEILYEQLAQRDVPAEEIVRVPLREIAFLRTAVIKWAADNTFTVKNILAIEEQLSATVTYTNPETGAPVERTVTGSPDLLVADPARNGIIIPDWKFSWRPPTERRTAKDDDELTYEGYFQQRFYSFLAFVAFPSIAQVSMREFYPMRTEARTATLHRDKDFEHLEREVTLAVELFDAAVASGPPRKVRKPLHDENGEVLTDDAGEVRMSAPSYTFESVGQWIASPGKHCANCPKPGACPVEEESRGEGAVTTRAKAQQYAAEREVAKAIVKHRTEACKPWVETDGPIPLRDSKGRRVLGWKPNSSGGRDFKSYVPDGSDRAPDVDETLMDAMREATARKRRERAKRPRRRKAAA